MAKLVICSKIYKPRCDGRQRVRKTSVRHKGAVEVKLKELDDAKTSQNNIVLPLPPPNS